MELSLVSRRGEVVGASLASRRVRSLNDAVNSQHFRFATSLLFTLATLAFVPTSRAELRVYDGSLGKKAEVAVLLSLQNEGLVEGRYFYRNKGDDIPLKGDMHEGTMTLSETNPKGVVTGKWTLKFEKDGVKGSWQAPGAKKKLEVSLNSDGNSAEAFENLRPEWKLPKIVKGATELEYRQSAKGRKYAYPHLIKFADPKMTAKMNKILDDYAKGLGCDDGDSDMDIAVSATLPFADVLEVSDSWSGQCAGAAHPQNGEGNRTLYDLNTATELSFASLFANFERDKAKIFQAVFGERIKEAVIDARKAPGAKSDSDDSCLANYLPDEIDQKTVLFEVSPEKKTLSIELTFPHSEAACNGDPVEVPVAKLLPFANANGLLPRMK